MHNFKLQWNKALESVGITTGRLGWEWREVATLATHEMGKNIHLET